MCEPSGNLIKRNVLESEGLNLTAHDPHPGKEFLASTDERFRPVHLAQGPDGALYVVDMYRGLIQHKAYVTPYLTEQTVSRKLVLPINRGRIWRVVPEDGVRAKPVKMSQMSSVELVGMLTNPDGWYRDMAQRLLVERNDRGSVQLLVELATQDKNSLGRFHALWTLEGMQALTPDVLFPLLNDRDELIRTTAVRLLEPFAADDKNIRARFQQVLSREWDQAPIQQVLQIAFSAAVLDQESAHHLLSGIVTRYDTSALIRDAVVSSLAGKEFSFMQKLLSSQAWNEQKPTREIFLEMLTSAIVRKRDPGEIKKLLAMLDVGKSSFGWRERTILTGMSIQGYAGKIPPLKLPAEPRILGRKDLGIADSQLQGLAALFEWPGLAARDTTAQKGVVLDEKEKEQFALGRKFYLSSCSGCHGNDGGGLNRFAPPLRGSEWVLGDENRVALIVLHGIEGPLQVAGRRYAEPEILPVMPGHSTLDDGTLAAILTYIRNEWGNQAGAVSRRTVGKIRLTNQGRVLPWTAEEVDNHVKQISQQSQEQQKP